MTATASTPFFWNDYQGDPKLRVCTLAAQGLWMRMLCLAAEAKRYGYVMVAGRAATPEDLAMIAGRPVEEITACIADLERNEVFSRDRNQTIYCRRMVRDAKKKRASSKGGKKGGRISADNKTGIHSTPDAAPKVTTLATPPPKARASSFSSSFSKETTATGSSSKQPIDRVCEALGVVLTEDPQRLNWPAQLRAMLDDGLDLERDVLPACLEAKARAIANLQWVRKRAEAEKAKRSVAAQVSEASRPIRYTDEAGWAKRLALYAENPIWLDYWGPRRGQPGHLCPDEFWSTHHHPKASAA